MGKVLNSLATIAVAATAVAAGAALMDRGTRTKVKRAAMKFGDRAMSEYDSVSHMVASRSGKVGKMAKALKKKGRK